MIIVGYVDAAFGDCVDTRRSTSGYIFMANGSPITWKSGRQTLVTLSSTKAKYVAARDGAKEAVWLRLLAEELGFEPNEPTTLLEDNNACIAQTENPLHHKRTKHIDISFHYTREQVKRKALKLERVDTANQLADMMTKPLDRTTFERLLGMLGMKDTQLFVDKTEVTIVSRGSGEEIVMEQQ